MKKESYRHLRGKPQDVQYHPDNTLPPRMSQVNDIYSPPDPEGSLQGPIGPGGNALY